MPRLMRYIYKKQHPKSYDHAITRHHSSLAKTVSPERSPGASDLAWFQVSGQWSGLTSGALRTGASAFAFCVSGFCFVFPVISVHRFFVYRRFL